MPRRVSIPIELVRCETPVCQKVNEAYKNAPIDYKQLLVKATREMRKNLEQSALDIAERLKISRSGFFYKLKKLGITFDELRQALKDEAEAEYQRKLETRKRKRLPPRDKKEFYEREIVRSVINRMRAQGRTETHIRSVINFWYRMCKETGLAPEDFLEMNKEELWDIVTEFISDKAEEGLDVESIKSMIQTIQKWLGTRILPPGITQKEYKGKYQEAEIPKEVRDKIVLNLIDEYQKTKNPDYIKTIQAMIFLFYTGSRRQALTNFTFGHTVRIKTKQFVEVFGEDTFRMVSTLEKRGIRWTKLIPESYARLLPNIPFDTGEIKRISRILKHQMNLYRNHYNRHTILYLDRNKIFHVWRHTATREYLRAFKFNRSLVAKLLGWIKESNLVIYGDFQLFQLLEIMAEEHKLEFVSPPVKKRLEQVILRSGLA